MEGIKSNGVGLLIKIIPVKSVILYCYSVKIAYFMSCCPRVLWSHTYEGLDPDKRRFRAKKQFGLSAPQTGKQASVVIFVVFAGLRLNNAWVSGTVLRPFLQPESPLSSRSLVSGFKCKLRDSNSRPPIFEAASSNH